MPSKHNGNIFLLQTIHMSKNCFTKKQFLWQSFLEGGNNDISFINIPRGTRFFDFSAAQVH